MQILDRPSANGHVHAETVRIPPPRRRVPWRAAAALVLILALVFTGVIVMHARAGGGPTYVTQPVARQDLVQTVTATGTINPQNTIDVGTQVSGTISEVDVDYNSKVKAGQVLARIDPTALQAQLDSARAALAQAQAQAASAGDTAGGSALGINAAEASANAAAATARAAQATALSSQQAIASANAGVTKAQSALALAQQTLARDKQLLSQGYIAQAQADTDSANVVAAQTALQTAQVAVQQAQSAAAASTAQAQAANATAAAQQSDAAVAQQTAAGSGQSANAATAAIGIQQAAVAQAATNLAHATITSPVNGTVIARDVSVGTTVAASLQTPTLFAIAQNLSKMEADLAVGEPDIGSVKAGEAVDFTVLAYPSRTFHGTVAQVRKNPTTTNNVVTYTTVVDVDNADQALLPGMTANATIHVQTAANALVVPAAALTYVPTRTGHGGTHGTAHAGSAWGATLGVPTANGATTGNARIFVLRNGRPQRVPVTVSLQTSTQAAVVPQTGATLAAGDAVIVGDSSTTSGTSHQRPTTTSNPLVGAPAGGMRMPRS